MAKKRKLATSSEASASPKLDSLEESAVKEPAATLPAETPAKGSLVEEKPKVKALDAVVSTDAHASDLAAAGDEDEEDENDPALLHNILEPFSKDQLLSILHDAALKYPDLRASILQTADVDPAHRKVFVHGLGWNITGEDLKEIFSQYGEIEDCKSVVNKLTGKSKGYGFILFKHRSGARRALKEPQKKIGNRMAACQLASIGPVPAPLATLPVSESTHRKIYVSNVGPDLDPQRILQFFSKFGEIEEGPLGLDKATGKPRGFCLFVYKSSEGVKKALAEPHKNFDGHILHCQQAIDGPKSIKQEIYLSQGLGGQYAGLNQTPVGFGTHGIQIGRSDGTVLMGGLPSQIGGPGHLIAPSASLGFNQSGLAGSNGLHAINSTFGHQVVGAGSYSNPSAMGVYGASQVQGSYGGAALGQGSVRSQAFSHMGGVGPYMGH